MNTESRAELAPTPNLSADCTRCVGLCCIFLAFDRSSEFGFDKVAGVACRNLSAGHRCTIHARRVELGFKGCADYDCAGAGQLATALFEDCNWQSAPELTRALGDAFALLRDVHELLLLLRATERLQLSTEQLQARSALLLSLRPKNGWSRQTLREFDLAGANARVYAFLRGLKRQARALLVQPPMNDISTLAPRSAPACRNSE